MSANGTARQHPAAELAGIHDAFQRLAALAQQPSEPQSSVQIEQAAKPGLPPRVTVKCYARDAETAADLASTLYDTLVGRYAVPAADGLAV